MLRKLKIKIITAYLLSAVSFCLSQGNSNIEVLPILSYDTDAGFGYGGKAFFLNQFHFEESFDVTAFNSTKGERWYRLVFSLPDFELRQGKDFGSAVDIIFDYDKWINNNYFSIGEENFDNRISYTKEPVEVELKYTHSLSETIQLSLSSRYRNVSSNNFSAVVDFPIDPSSYAAYSVITLFRFDTRDSHINPKKGNYFEGSAEYVLPKSSIKNYFLLKGEYRGFTHLIHKEIIAAFRFSASTRTDHSPMLPAYISAGGNSTLRGFVQDRFLGNSLIISNVELRFPIAGKFGGLAGFDAAAVGKGLFNNFIYKGNLAAGLRYYFDTFIVRLDFGFSQESIGFYLNFGHIF
jgi:outer membrane protein assembly factor BamA